MADLDYPTKIVRNLQRDAESLRHVQDTTLGIKRLFSGYQAGDLETLRSLRMVLRGAVTRLLKAATELRQAPSPSPSFLLEATSELVRKDDKLNQLNETIGEMLEGDEFEIYYSDALLYQEKIRRAVSRLRSPLNDLKAPGNETVQHFRSGYSPQHTEDEAEHKDMPAGGSNKVAWNVRIGKLVEQAGTCVAEQYGSAAVVQSDGEKREVIHAKENTKHPPCQLDYFFLPDFIKGESLRCVLKICHHESSK